MRYTRSNLVLCTSPDGWSLHAPGSTDEDIASGSGHARAINSGPGEPSDADYEAALRVVEHRVRVASRKLARELFDDDMSRVENADDVRGGSVTVTVERDGHKAFEGWLQASRDAGDHETRDALLAVDRDVFAGEWNALSGCR